MTPLTLGWGLVKGTIVGSVATVIGLEFWQGVIVAVISGTLGVAGTSLAAYIAARETRHNREAIYDVRDQISELTVPPYPAPPTPEENGA